MSELWIDSNDFDEHFEAPTDTAIYNLWEDIGVLIEMLEARGVDYKAVLALRENGDDDE